MRCPGRRLRDEQRPRRVLTEARAVERRLAHLLHDEVLQLVGLHHQLGEGRRLVGVGEMERDAVVRPDELHLETERIPHTGCQRHRPRRVHAATERGEDADAPVADLVSEALHHDGAIGGHDATVRGRLLAQEGDEVPRGELVEVEVVPQPRQRLRVGERHQLPGRLPDTRAELEGAADALALPEGHRTGHSRRGGDEDAVARDLLDPPG